MPNALPIKSQSASSMPLMACGTTPAVRNDALDVEGVLTQKQLGEMVYDNLSAGNAAVAVALHSLIGRDLQFSGIRQIATGATFTPRRSTWDSLLPRRRCSRVRAPVDRRGWPFRTRTGQAQPIDFQLALFALKRKRCWRPASHPSQSRAAPPPNPRTLRRRMTPLPPRQISSIMALLPLAEG